MSKHAIVHWVECEGTSEWVEDCEIPPEQAALGALQLDLVSALQGATPEQMQEIADAVVLLKTGPMAEITTVYGRWHAVDGQGRQGSGDTRAEALRALAEQVKGLRMVGKVRDTRFEAFSDDELGLFAAFCQKPCGTDMRVLRMRQSVGAELERRKPGVQG